MTLFDEGIAVAYAAGKHLHANGAGTRLGNRSFRNGKIASRAGDLNGLHHI